MFVYPEYSLDVAIAVSSGVLLADAAAFRFAA